MAKTEIDYVEAVNEAIAKLKPRLKGDAPIKLIVGWDFFEKFNAQLMERVKYGGFVFTSGKENVIQYHGFDVIRSPDMREEPMFSLMAEVE